MTTDTLTTRDQIAAIIDTLRTERGAFEAASLMTDAYAAACMEHNGGVFGFVRAEPVIHQLQALYLELFQNEDKSL